MYHEKGKIKWEICEKGKEKNGWIYYENGKKIEGNMEYEKGEYGIKYVKRGKQYVGKYVLWKGKNKWS